MVEDKKEAPKFSREQEIAFLRGSLTTLVQERNELVRITQNVEAIMQMNFKRLEELGVKISVNQEKK